MKTRVFSASLFLITVGAVVAMLTSRHAASAAGTSTAARFAAAPTYVVDGVHSSIIFKVKHNGVANFYGRFDSSSGSFTLADGGGIDLAIRVDSVNTGFGERNEHLKSPDFFSAKEYPHITFKSTSVKKLGDTGFEAAGDLTIRGVTRSLTVTIQQTGTSAARAGLETRVALNRSDFGVSYDRSVSDEVELIVSLEGQQQ